MIDPIMSLAFSVWSSPGVYALLIGSGVSRASQMPTAWDVTIDLIRRLAAAEGQDCGSAPDEWYKATYGKEPDYSELLGMVAPSAADRRQLLKGYFEPADEEREQGIKMPTHAHRAIANLVAGGFVKVIVTTNFDRLIEIALEAQGITPTVISTTDAVRGALPLAHSSCTVIKVNGDYMDVRTKNIRLELAKYDRPLAKLIDQTLDEYGLIVCGWSAKWDTALRGAIMRCPTRRFTTFWATRSQPEEVAAGVIKHRSAVTLEIEDAESFFTELVEKVLALRDVASPHPLSPKVAAATAKRYLSEDRHRISLHDLAVREANRLHEAILDAGLDPSVGYSEAELARRVESYEAITAPLASVFAVGCYWGGAEHVAIWRKCLKRVGNVWPRSSYIVPWQQLMRYPALLLLYAGGIASVAAGRYDTLGALLEGTTLTQRPSGPELASAVLLYPRHTMIRDTMDDLPPTPGWGSRLSVRLESVLKAPLADILPEATVYQTCFDRFEYLWAIAYIDLRHVYDLPSDYPHFGCFACRGAIERETDEELATEGEDWPPLSAGLFGGSLQRLQAAKKVVDDQIREWGWPK